MGDTLTRHDGSRVRLLETPRGSLASAPLDGRPRLAREGALAAAIAGRPSFDDAELAEIAERQGAAPALIRGYLQHGPRVVDRVRGGFSLAVVHLDEPRALLAIDRVGGRFPLYYRTTEDAIVFGSTADAIRAHPRGRTELDPQALYDYLYFHVVPGPRSAWRDLHRLLPGSLLRFEGGSAVIERYWAPRYVEDASVRLAELETEFLDLLRRSVRGAAAGGKTGCFLSGGTDSSTIAGMLSEESGSPVPSFSIGFDAERYDEMKYARIAAKHFGTEHHEYYLQPDDVVDLIPRVARAYSEPFGNESVVPSFHCARMAREQGLDRLLGGDGGDELFAGNERYIKQRVFEAYGRVPAALRRSLLEPVLFGFPGGDRIWPVRKAKSYIRQANIPMPDRIHTYAYLERMGVEEMLEPEFVAGVDTDEPRRLTREAYHGASAGTMLNRFLAMDLRFTLADNDLPKVSGTCALAGIAVGYPFLSDELIDFAARLPVGLKLKGSKLRWFFKRALRDFLPPEIIHKTKHGMGMPFGVWLEKHQPLQELTRDSMDGLKQRGIVRAPFIDRVMELHRREHAVYYGVMLWVLVQLEQWLRVHADPLPSGDPSS